MGGSINKGSRVVGLATRGDDYMHGEHLPQGRAAPGALTPLGHHSSNHLKLARDPASVASAATTAAAPPQPPTAKHCAWNEGRRLHFFRAQLAAGTRGDDNLQRCQR